MAPSATSELGQANGFKDISSRGFGHVDNEVYVVSEAPLGTSRQIRIITIGAGASGLNMARHVELHLQNVQHIIYEKNEEVGGTWFENRSAALSPKTKLLLRYSLDILVVHVIFRHIIINLPGRQIQTGHICRFPRTLHSKQESQTPF
jgi:hypothetical protein